MRVDVITLGCSKNLVDSEKLLKQFEAEGYTVRHDPNQIDADIVVINTCGFIGDAQEESIEMDAVSALPLANLYKVSTLLSCWAALAERTYFTIRSAVVTRG